MITIRIFVLLTVCTFITCKTNDQQNKLTLKLKEENSKWFFYAYLDKNEIILEKGDTILTLPSIECDVTLDETHRLNDTTIFIFNFNKKGYIFKQISKGLVLRGIGYVRSHDIYFPITGMSKLDSFEYVNFVRRDNLETDAKFRDYLRKSEKNRISKWLLHAAVEKGVWD